MRGARGVEKDIPIGNFWEKTLTGELAYQIDRTFRSLVNGFTLGVPTLYARMTFTVEGVTTKLTAGSPKLLAFKARRRSVRAWFVSGGLAYTLRGAEEQTEKLLDKVKAAIREAGGAATFFLEFVTCRAYVVKS